MEQGKKKSVGEYGHEGQDCRDNSEKIEWEEHYKSRSRKWGKEGAENGKEIGSNSEQNASITSEMDDDLG